MLLKARFTKIKGAGPADKRQEHKILLVKAAEMTTDLAECLEGGILINSRGRAELKPV